MVERHTRAGSLGITVDRAATLYYEALSDGVTPRLIVINDATYDELITAREPDLARHNPMMLLDMDVVSAPDCPVGEPRLEPRHERSRDAR